jgi:hypothetical protein
MYLILLLILIFLCNSANAALKQITLYSEDFLLGPNGWNIQGNTNKTNNIVYETYSINSIINRYIVGKEGLINVNYKRKDDLNLWYFTTELSTPINISNIPNLIISFNMYGFVGNFSDTNLIANPLVKLVGSNGFVIQTKPNAYPFNSHFNIQLNQIQKIDAIKQIYILGDWTRWYETVGLDNVQISTWI